MKAVRVLAALLLCGCPEFQTHSPPRPLRVALPLPTLSAPPGMVTLRLGMLPYLPADTMRASHAPLAAYLGRSLSVPVTVVVADTYGDGLERWGRGELDVIELSPYAYAVLALKHPLNCLVQTLSDGTSSAAGYIFVSANSPRRTLNELKGATFAFVDPYSTSGYLYPKKVMLERGFDPDKDLRSTAFLGNHEAVLLAVLAGHVEAGATFQGAFAALKRSRGIDPLAFRVVAKTPRTPRDIVCVQPSLPKDVADAIAHALLRLSPRDEVGRTVLSPLNMNGFQPVDERSYDDVRKAAAELASP